MEYNKLRGKIREMSLTEEQFANKMNLSRQTISAKLNGIKEWKTSEVARACEILSISLDEAHLFFYR